MTISEATLRSMHLCMVRMRCFEEKAGALMESNLVPGALHLYTGQEAVEAGVMQLLDRRDQITSTPRGHGHCIAKGGQFPEMFAELVGRKTGYCKGRGGSMHIADRELGILGANGIVGGGFPIALGAAFSNKFHNSKRVTVCFFGDGASNEGGFHEVMNMAALYKLPIVFACENNLYGEYTPQQAHQVVVDIAERAAGYGMSGSVVDGMDVMAVYRAAAQAIENARSGKGPTLLEFKTYRYYDHVGVRGMGLSYRTDEEIESWKLRDPISNLETYLLGQSLTTKVKIANLYKKVAKEIASAVEYAQSSPSPESSELLKHVYTTTTFSSAGESR